MGLGGSDTDSYCPGTGATAILASCLRSLGKGVGVNYNQTVKAIHTNFNDRRAVALLARLEKYTQEHYCPVKAGKSVFEIVET